MTKPVVYHVGDTVKILESKPIKRVGYRLIFTDLMDEARNDPRTLQAYNLLLRGEELSACKLPLLAKAERIPYFFVEAAAKLMVQKRGFGGRERTIHYFEGQESQEWLCKVGGEYQITKKRTAKTGVYNPAYYGPSSDHSGDDYDPPSLGDSKTHVILTLNTWVEIEACHVQLVKKA